MEKFFIFLSFNLKQTFLYSRFIAHKLKYFKSFLFFFNSDGYDLQLRKIKNSVSQKIGEFHFELD